MSIPTNITAPMVLALADLLTEPVTLAGETRWINANTRRAIVRRKLAVINGGAVFITSIGRMVISAYLLGGEDVKAQVARGFRTWS